jgi:cyclic pyranopterin phosphate synthase
MRDKLGRVIDYMRVSVTEKCNLRCNYCMPRGNELSNSVALSLDEILRICRVAASTEIGIRKFKITGGEPLIRENVTDLIAELKNTDGIDEVTLTTNGILLEKYADKLVRAGIDRVNISLDSLNEEHYRKITGSDSLDSVLRGISALEERNIPIRINTVLQRGINENDFWELSALAENHKIDVRFIEMMPIGEGRGFEPVLNADIIRALSNSIEPDCRRGNGPAIYYTAKDFKGRIGFISAISNRFCDNCNRIRLTSTGFLKGCLCYNAGVDLAPLLSYNDDRELSCAIRYVIENKPKGHSFEDLKGITETKEMNKIGG